MRSIQLKCATWNIHRAKGRDRRVDPDRIASAIAQELAPEQLDLLALQEADEECSPHARIVDIERIASDTGLQYQHEPENMRWGPESDGFLGTIIFLHPRYLVTHREVLDLPGHCHRGAVVIEANQSGIPVRLISAHLSLFQPLRVLQMRIIGQYLYRRPEMQTVLLGDFNEWRPWGGLMFHPRLLGRRVRGPVKATFPSGQPILPLDRILTDRNASACEVRVLRSPILSHASDHLPLIGTITVS